MAVLKSKHVQQPTLKGLGKLLDVIRAVFEVLFRVDQCVSLVAGGVSEHVHW